MHQQYLKDRATADRKYRLPGGASGSTTDCGRLFILFRRAGRGGVPSHPVPGGGTHEAPFSA